MPSATKSVLMLLSMLILGLVLGAAGMVVLRSDPPLIPPPGERPGGFVSHMLETIQPRDAAQRAVITGHLEAIDQQNRAVVDQSRRAMRGNLDSMMVRLAPLLNADQRTRLETLVRSLDRPPPRRGGPPPR